MLTRKQKIAIVVALCVYVVSLWAYALSGFPTEALICDPPGSAKDCNSHNILLTLVLYALYELNFYGVLITAIATGVIAKFTVTLARVGRQQIEDTHILERAYIVAEPYGIDTFTDGKQIVGYTGIRNAGRMPATKLQWFSRLTLSDSGKWNGTWEE